RVETQQFDEPSDVRVVERGLDLVEKVEGARPREEEREQEGDRAERLLAPGEKREPLHAPPGGAKLHLHALAGSDVGKAAVARPKGRAAFGGPGLVLVVFRVGEP